MPIRSPVYRNNIIDTMRKVADDARDPQSVSAIVINVDVVGSALVRFEGGHNTVEVECSRDLNVQPGDRVKLSRIPGGRWAVDRAYNSNAISGGSAGISTEEYDNTPLVPDSLAAFGVAGAVVAMWNPPASINPLIFEIEHADDASGTNAQYIRTTGSNVVIEATTTRYIRARSMNFEFAQSGWTNIVSATPTPLSGGIGVDFEAWSSF